MRVHEELSGVGRLMRLCYDDALFAGVIGIDVAVNAGDAGLSSWCSLICCRAF